MIRLQTDPSHVNKFFHSLALVAINTSQFRLDDRLKCRSVKIPQRTAEEKKTNMGGWVGWFSKSWENNCKALSVHFWDMK